MDLEPKGLPFHLGDLCLWLWQGTSLSHFPHLWNGRSQCVRIKMLVDHKFLQMWDSSVIVQRFINNGLCPPREPNVVKAMTLTCAMWVYHSQHWGGVFLDQLQCKGVVRMAEPPGFTPPGFADGLNMGLWDVRERVLDDYDCRVFAWSARLIESPLIGAGRPGGRLFWAVLYGWTGFP